MLSHITGKDKHTEVTADITTFNIIVWIRARRLRWVGHSMRLQHNNNGEPRQIKETLRMIFDNRQPGDLLMDVEDITWEALQKSTNDRDTWKTKVQLNYQPPKTNISGNDTPTTNTTIHLLPEKKHP